MRSKKIETYGVDGVEYLRGDAVDGGRDLEPKYVRLPVLGFQEGALVDGVDDLPGVGKLDPLPRAVAACAWGSCEKTVYGQRLGKNRGDER